MKKLLEMFAMVIDNDVLADMVREQRTWNHDDSVAQLIIDCIYLVGKCPKVLGRRWQIPPLPSRWTLSRLGPGWLQILEEMRVSCLW
jgi:hypothetical protein